MGLKDIIAKVRTGATGAVTRHRDKIDQGLEKIGEAARPGPADDTRRTSGRAASRHGSGWTSSRPTETRAGPAPTTPTPACRTPVTADRPEKETPMSLAPTHSRRLRRAAAGLAIVVLPLTMAASCDVDEEQDQQEQHEDQEGDEEDDR